MKTSEFIEKVEKLDFIWMTERKDGFIFIRTTNGSVAHISEVKKFCLSLYFDEIFMNDRESETLLNLLTEYAATPISERKDKTIEEKAREYIQEYVSDHLSFESARDFLECCNLYITDNGDFKNLIMHSYEEIAEYSKIYDWYRDHSNEFVELWCEVAADEH